MPFEIVRNDIVNMQVDAIVNTANPRPVIGSGVDAAIHAKAGPQLLEARRRIGTMNTGEACVTPGFDLPCRCVIHTVGPVWHDGGHGEAFLLKQCYAHALKLALRHGCASVAFPLISTGNYGFPKKLALQIAVDTIRDFLEKHEMQIYLVVFGQRTLELSGELVDSIRSFIDEAYVRQRQEAEYSFSFSRDYAYVREKLEAREPLPPEWELREGDLEIGISGERQTPEPRKRRSLSLWEGEEKKASVQTPFDAGELDRMVQKVDKGFSETLLSLIDRAEKNDVDVYKKANVSRKLFSKIRNNPYYKPSKTTAVAFAIALELDLEQTRDLIGRAGYALSRSDKFDIIVEYFITHGRYDIYEINMTLFEFDQTLLGVS